MNKANYSEVMKELRQEYLEGFEEKFKFWNQCFEDENWDQLELEFHKMKGTGSTYGVPEVSLLCQHLERICRQTKPLPRPLLDSAIRMLSAIKEKYLHDREYSLGEDPDFEKIQNLS